MAQFYTLEEAAHRLGIPTDEFKRKIKTEWTSIRPFRDGATLRFRAADIDELARSLGAASDPGLPLGPVGSQPPEEASDEITVAPAARRPADEPLGIGLDDAPDDAFTVPTAGDSGIGKKPIKPGSDSDVRLELSSPPAHDPDAAIPTEEISLDVGGSASGVLKPGSGKLSAPKSGSTPKSGSKLTGKDQAKIPGPSATPPDQSDSSEFELSLDSDSDSFELQLSGDSSEEVDLGAMAPKPGGSKAGQSGINLGKPSDSGVSLEKKGGKSSGPVGPTVAGDADSDVDFELSLDPAGASGVRLSGPKSKPPKKPAAEDSSSEFELTLDDNSGVAEGLAAEVQGGQGDIFETDFELPAMSDESGSEVVAVDGADTDLDGTGFEVDVNDLDAPVEDESASQVVLVDDDAPIVDDDAPVVMDDDDVLAGSVLDDGASASRALRGVPRSGVETGPVQTVVQTAPKWGPLPAIVLAPTLLVAFLGMLMSFELLRGMWGYHSGGKPGGTLVRGVADMVGMKVND